MSEETCSNCKFFASVGSKDYPGECRFHPPTPPRPRYLPQGNGGIFVADDGRQWAQVWPNMFCGQFLPTPNTSSRSEG